MLMLRRTQTMCPTCGEPLEGQLELRGEQVVHTRSCPNHGEYAFHLSRNGASYVDLDHYYFDLFGETEPKGRITNYWVIMTRKCQAGCNYCTLLDRPFWEEMSLDAFRAHLDAIGKTKITLTGGDPTAREDLLEFVKEGRKRGIIVQLATNGLALASQAYCQSLKNAGVEEVRLSIDSFRREDTYSLGTENLYEAKLRALESLEAVGLTTSLSPTIFKGVNERQLIESIDFALDRPFIRSLSVNGFAWAGRGASFDQNMMMMPDAMMDVIYEHYAPEDRAGGMTFQKILLAMVHLLRIRLCLNTQIIIFVRTRQGMRLITDYLNMKRAERAIRWWRRFAKRGDGIRALTLLPVLAASLRFRSLRLIPACVQLLIANLFDIAISRYPARLLPVVMNTNCSPLNADGSVGLQCMSGNLFVRDGEQAVDTSSRRLLAKESERLGATPRQLN